MPGRGHKSGSPNAAKHAAGGKLSRETHGYNGYNARMDDNNCYKGRSKRNRAALLKVIIRRCYK